MEDDRRYVKVEIIDKKLDNLLTLRHDYMTITKVGSNDAHNSHYLAYDNRFRNTIRATILSILDHFSKPENRYDHILPPQSIALYDKWYSIKSVFMFRSAFLDNKDLATVNLTVMNVSGVVDPYTYMDILFDNFITSEEMDKIYEVLGGE